MCRDHLILPPPEPGAREGAPATDPLPRCVYVVDHLIGLGDEGPFVEFRPRDDSSGGRFLPVFSARHEIPGSAREDAESVPISLLALALDEDVRVVLDPGSRAVVVTRDQLRVLADVVDVSCRQ
jgi:hypothetical protein